MSRPRIAFVGSGGATKGIAHVGVLRAMEELGLSADVFVGASAGAIASAFIAQGFEADWARVPFAPDEHAALLWSTTNSRRIMSRFIDDAKRSLSVQHPKFVDATVLARLVEAQARGVHVKVLCGGKHGISDTDIPDTFSSLRILGLFGVKVRRQKKPKLHAKLLLSDGGRALIGSMNIDRSAFDLRRELGIIVDDAPILKRLIEVFDRDWDDAHHWDAPDPLAVTHPDDGELPHDPNFLHE